jgi:hypothetical protein|tara:strand:+ start:544 stop:729 length:186 start_codon:yes stop_codon:yes gene_type:complete
MVAVIDRPLGTFCLKNSQLHWHTQVLVFHGLGLHCQPSPPLAASAIEQAVTVINHLVSWSA